MEQAVETQATTFRAIVDGASGQRTDCAKWIPHFITIDSVVNYKIAKNELQDHYESKWIFFFCG